MTVATRIVLCDDCAGFEVPTAKPTCRSGLVYQDAIAFKPCAECSRSPHEERGHRVYETCPPLILHVAYGAYPQAVPRGAAIHAVHCSTCSPPETVVQRSTSPTKDYRAIATARMHHLMRYFLGADEALELLDPATRAAFDVEVGQLADELRRAYDDGAHARSAVHLGTGDRRRSGRDKEEDGG